MTPLDAVQRCADACWGYVRNGGGAQLVLWSPDVRRLHLLNETAAAVWEALSKPMELAAVSADLAHKYRVDPETIARDISVVIGQLIDGQLVALSNSAPAEINLVDQPLRLPPTYSTDLSLGPYRALNATLLVDVHDQQLRDGLEPILEPLRTGHQALEDPQLIHIEVRSAGDGFVVARNGMARARANTRGHGLRAVLAEVNSAPLDILDGAVVLHAAGVEFSSGSGDDQLVVFPGVSNSGKSTLAAQLCLRGHRYLTDEAVAIDTSSLEAIAFHKALCVEPGAQELLVELAPHVNEPLLSTTWDINPLAIGNGDLSAGGPIGAIVFPTYSAVVDEAVFETLEPLDVLQRLIANAFDFGRVGQSAFSTLVKIANSVPAFTLNHGGGGAELDLLERRFGSVAARAARHG